jgi:hypothetical protein
VRPLVSLSEFRISPSEPAPPSTSIGTFRSDALVVTSPMAMTSPPGPPSMCSRMTPLDGMVS